MPVNPFPSLVPVLSCTPAAFQLHSNTAVLFPKTFFASTNNLKYFSLMAEIAHLFDPETDPEADLIDSDEEDVVLPVRSEMPPGSEATW